MQLSIHGHSRIGASYIHRVKPVRQFHPVAYLGFQKGGGRGAKFSLATSAHTKGGQTKFSNFFSMSNKFFFAQKGGHGLMAPPKYASGSICPVCLTRMLCPCLPWKRGCSQSESDSLAPGPASLDCFLVPKFSVVSLIFYSAFASRCTGFHSTVVQNYRNVRNLVSGHADNDIIM